MMATTATTPAPATTSMEEEQQLLKVSTSEPAEFLDIYDDDSPLGKQVIVVASSPKSATIMNYEGCEDKAQDIRECLQMHSESCSNTVDLWELRQLAVSTGGLLSPSLRQVAWPLLTGVSMSALEEEASNQSSFSLDENNTTSIFAEKMQNDIEKTIWSLEELVRQSQSGKESFWYAPLLQATTSCGGGKSGGGGSSSLADAAPSIVPLSSPCSSSELSSAESLTTNNSPLKAKTSTPTSTTTTGPSPQDQILLKKVLTKALKGGQTEYPVAGLANFAALFMINMESTSLSSLLLTRLISYPLKAAFSGADNDVSKVQAMMKCLLEEFQPTTRSGDDDDDIIIQSKTEEALAWFSGSQTSSLQAASRLMDVFLVSHPLFPLYVGAAAVQTTTPPLSWNMEKVEELITKALEYMEKLPPSQLMKAANTITFLPSTPSWAIAATVTADWVPSDFHHQEKFVAGEPFTTEEREVRQQAEPFSDEDSNSDWERISATSQAEIYDNDNDDKDTVQSAPTRETLFHDSYPLAMTAAGLGLPSSAASKSRSLQLPPPPETSVEGSNRHMKLVFLITAIVAVLVAAWSQPASYGNVPPSLIKGTPLPSPAAVGSVPPPRLHKEKFLGLIPVERPAPKKVLRTTTRMMMSTSQPMVVQRRAMGASTKSNTKKEKPAKGTAHGPLPVQRMLAGSSMIVMAPSTVPLKVAPPKATPVTAPSAPAVEPTMKKTEERPPQPLVPSTPPKKLTFMVRKDEVKKPAKSTPPAAEEISSSIKKTLQSWSSTTKLFEPQRVAVEAPVRKFQPFRHIKMQLKKVGRIWSKVVTFVRRRVGRGKETQ